MPLGSHCTVGKEAFFIVLIGKKTNPGLLGCIIHNGGKNLTNMGMTKEAVLASDFDSVVRASLQLLILDPHAAIYM